MSEPTAPKSTSWDPEAKPAAGADATVERGFFADLLVFAWENKWWWIVPTLVILLGLGTMIFFAQEQQIAPFFYALF